MAITRIRVKVGRGPHYLGLDNPYLNAFDRCFAANIGFNDNTSNNYHYILDRAKLLVNILGRINADQIRPIILELLDIIDTTNSYDIWHDNRIRVMHIGLIRYMVTQARPNITRVNYSSYNVGSIRELISTWLRSNNV